MLGKIFKRFRKIDDDIIIAHASPLAVPTLIGVVGDVHGCATLTGKLIDKLRDNHPVFSLPEASLVAFRKYAGPHQAKDPSVPHK